MDDKTDGSSVVQIMQAVCDEICRHYCKYADNNTQDELDEHCNNCPLNQLQ